MEKLKLIFCFCSRAPYCHCICVSHSVSVCACVCCVLLRVNVCRCVNVCVTTRLLSFYSVWVSECVWVPAGVSEWMKGRIRHERKEARASAHKWWFCETHLPIKSEIKYKLWIYFWYSRAQQNAQIILERKISAANDDDGEEEETAKNPNRKKTSWIIHGRIENQIKQDKKKTAKIKNNAAAANQ